MWAFLTSDPLTPILSCIFHNNLSFAYHFWRFIHIVRVGHQLRKLCMCSILRVKALWLLLIILTAHFNLDLDFWRSWLAVHGLIQHTKRWHFFRLDNSASLSLVNQFLIPNFLQDLKLIHVLLMEMLLRSVLILFLPLF